MATQEVILKVGAEGGSIALYGTRTDRTWVFSLDVDDQTPTLMDESPIHCSQTIDASFQHALKLLGRYPWHKLYPLNVHPEFRSVVLDEVRKRFGSEGEMANNLAEWERVCEA